VPLTRNVTLKSGTCCCIVAVWFAFRNLICTVLTKACFGSALATRVLRFWFSLGLVQASAVSVKTNATEVTQTWPARGFDIIELARWREPTR
jgi:hypothetical protein